MRVVDLFAGCGGFTLGAELAGANVVWAANHWPLAVRTHSTNHPNVQHECQDLMQKNWLELPEYDLLTASPVCTGHSMGSQPKRGPQHEAMRTTAWAVVDCVEATRPKAFLVENVEQFLLWKLFDLWLAALERLGYHVTAQVLNASRCGVPQRRKRLIVAGSLIKKIEIREPGTEEPSFDDCLDDGLKYPSFIHTSWRKVSSAGFDSRNRMLAASALHGRCLVQHVTGHRGIPLHEPIRTITTKAQWCLVDGDRYRWLTPRELARGMSFPDSYWFPEDATIADQKKLIGNAIPPLMAKAAVEQILQ
jgi:DNA (cytosine-5)-methyltransferase 1